jgi:hypothetical protein
MLYFTSPYNVIVIVLEQLSGRRMLQIMSYGNIVFVETSHSHVTFVFKTNSISSLVEYT